MAVSMFLARVTGDRAEVFRIDAFEAVVVNEVHKTVRTRPRTPRAWRVNCHWLDVPRPMGCAIGVTATAAREAARRALLQSS